MVFAGLFPTDSDDYPELRDALERLKLNDAALFYEPETSQALGFGFRCGFLGLLHMEIVRERLEREFDLDLLVTAPNVAYSVKQKNGAWVEVHNPADMPRDPEEVQEPYVRAQVIVPKDYVGAVMELCTERRGRFDHMEYLSETRVLLTYELPLGEIVYDFYDQLKSRTRGYASFDYDLAGFKDGELARVDVLVGGEQVDALSLIAHRDAAYERGKLLVERLREEIPRQMFDVPIQAAIGSRVIARETVKAKRKDVLAKCYGGDITPQAQAAREAEEGQEAHEAGRGRRGAAGGLPRGPQPRRREEEAVTLRVPVARQHRRVRAGCDRPRRRSGPRGVRHLYVHLPFCVHRCGYCDFVTAVGRRDEHAAYADALLAELERRALAARRRCRDGLRRRRHADLHRAGGACDACSQPPGRRAS